MKPEINEILEELYELDNSLKEKEIELVNIISKMIESKPNIAIDSIFKTELKTKILSQMSNKNKTFKNLSVLKYLLTFLSGIAVLTLFLNIFPDIFNVNTQKNGIKVDDNSINIAFAPKIVKLDKDNAFGKLSFNEQVEKGSAGLGVSNKSMGAEGNSLQTNELQSDIQISTLPVDNGLTRVDPTVDSKMAIPYPDYIQKSYVYNLKAGEKLPEIPASMYVYKNKTSGINTINTDISNILKTDIIDFSKLKNMGLLNMSIFEDIKDGYQFDISLSEGSIYIYRNYQKWAQVDYNNQKQLAVNDLPSDDSVIKVANDFVKKYSINVSSFLKPIVNNTWRNEYARMDNKLDYYIPDILSIIYQFNIDGIGVHETYGNPYGLETTINVRDMKVNSLGPIQKMDLSGSKYDLITSSGEIIEIAKKGPYYNVFMDTAISEKPSVGAPRMKISQEESVPEQPVVDLPVVNNSSMDIGVVNGDVTTKGYYSGSAGSSNGSTGIDDSIKYEEVQVEIGNAKLVYLRKYIYNEINGISDQYFVPGILFEVITKNNDEKMIYPGEFVAVPLVKDFLDNK